MAIQKKKKSMDLLVFIFIVAIMLTSYSSYSRYTSSVNTSANVDVAAWNVEVNTEDVTNSTTLTENLTFNILGADTTKVASGKIAPASKGYFDVSINTSGSEVAAQYTVTVDMSNVSTLNGLTVIGYALNDTSNDLTAITPLTVSNNEATISGTILLGNNYNSTVNVRVFLEWVDSGNSADNQAQTAFASSSNSSPV